MRNRFKGGKSASAIILLGLLTVLAGCGGGGGSDDDTPPSDTTPPQLVNTSPAALQTDVSIDAVITATFNEDMDTASITATSFHLDGLPGSVSYDAPSRTATITPDTPLPYAVEVTAVITTGVRDLAGNALPKLQSLSFTTEADSVAPSVIGRSPAALTTDVTINAAITSTFSENMDVASISASSFFLNGLPGSVSYDAPSRTATITPDTPLPYAMEVTAVVTTDVTDLAGNALPLLQSWSFTTEADSIAPGVRNRSPVADQIDVLLNSGVEVQFSEAMDPVTLNSSTFTLMLNGGAQISAMVDYDVLSQTATLMPASPLNYQSSYTAILSASIADLAGNSLGADVVWSFETELELTPPQVISTSPADLAIDVSRNTIINIVFSEALDSTTVTPSNFLINGQPANSVFLLSDGKTVRVAHDLFDYGSNQTITVTTGVIDLFGNALIAPFNFGFSVLFDVIAPTITGSAPIEGSRMIARDFQDFRVRFNEAMDPSTINSGTVTLTNSTGSLSVAGMIDYDPGQRQLSFIPGGLLPPATDLVFAVSALVTDESGNPLGQPFSTAIRTVSAHERLNNLTASTTGAPTLSFDSSGDGIALWTHDTGTGFDLVWSAYTSSGNSWSTEQILFTGHNQSAFPGLKVVNNGSDHAIAWRSDEGIHAAIYSAGAWQPTALLSNRGSPAQLVTNGRDFALSWTEFSNTSVSVHNKLSRAGWSAKEQPAGIRNATLVARGEPGSIGDFMLLARTTTRQISSFRYLQSSLSWSQAVSVFSVTEGTLSGIKISGSGRDYMATWVHSTTLVSSTPHHLYTRRFNGTSWRAEQKLIELADSPGTPFLASNGRSELRAQRFLLMYNSGSDLAARVFANGIWGIAADPTGSQTSTFIKKIVSDGDGFMIVWTAPAATLQFVNVYNAGSWDIPLQYESGSANADAVGNLGTYTLLWAKRFAQTTLARTYSSGVWSNEVQVGTAAATGPSPTVAQRPGGFAGAWDTGEGVRASLLKNTWSPQLELVQNLHPSSVEQPRITRSGSNAVAAWLQTQDGEQWFKLHTNLFSDGRWNGAVQMDGGLVSDFTILGGGNLFVLLYVPAQNNPQLFARVLDISSGAWGFRTEIGRTDSFVSFDLTYNGSEFIAAWTRDGDLQISRLTSSGWSAPEIVISGTSSASASEARVVASGADYRVFARKGQTLSNRFFSSALNAWDAEATVGLGPSFGSWSYDAASNGNGWTTVWTATGGVRRRTFEDGLWGTTTTVNSNSFNPQIVSDGNDYLIGVSRSVGLSGTRNLSLSMRRSGNWGNLSGTNGLVDFDLGGGGAGFAITAIIDDAGSRRLGSFAVSNGQRGTLSYIDAGVGPVIETSIASTPSVSDYSVLWTQSDGSGAGAQLWGASGM